MTPRRLSLAAILAVLIGAIAILSGSSGSDADAGHRAIVVLAAHAPASSKTFTVGGPLAVRPVTPGFVGLSFEYQSIAVDAGSPQHPDRVMDQLIENLAPGQHPVIRIGGDSADHTWWPVPGRSKPGLSFALTPAWIASVGGLASRIDARMMPGIDLEMNDPALAAVEARHLVAGIGASHILALEIGNEPSLYGSFPWVETIPHDLHTGLFMRPHSYDFANFVSDYERTAARLPRLPLAGPALGSIKWMQSVGQLIAAEPRLDQVTLHSYPTNCFAPRDTPNFPSIPNLLSPLASDALAAGVAPFASQAHAAGRAFRIDELNSVACGGTAGVSDTFASALWMADTLFAMARTGADGVNVQDFNAGRYKPFAFSQVDGTWQARVYPVYYGMLLFEDAAPQGSKLLNLPASGPGSVRAWAAATPVGSVDHGATTVTLINPSSTATQTVTVSAPHSRGARFLRMQAPGGAAARRGVTLGGQGFGTSTSSGQLSGTPAYSHITPRPGGRYVVSLPAASAALLILDR